MLKTLIRYVSFFATWVIITTTTSIQPVHAQSCTLLQSSLQSPQHYPVYDANQNGIADRDGDVWTIPDSTGATHILIKFAVVDQHKTAFIYTNDVVTSEALCKSILPGWIIRIVADGSGWYLANGLPDWNLSLTLHSYYSFQDTEYELVLAQNPDQMPANWPPNATRNVVEIKTHDLNNDGSPEDEYDNVDVAGPYPLISVNIDKTWRPVPGDLLPVIGPMIVLTADHRAIARLKHLIPIRYVESGYSFVFGRPAGGSTASFAVENPFAFYDLHGNHDGESELKLRAITEDQDRHNDAVTTYSEFRYSWAQQTELQHYRFYLIGDPPIDEVHTYSGIRISHLDYQKLPDFVISQVWLGAAFAEYESDSPRSFTEGIYESLIYTPQVRSKLLDRAAISLAPYTPPYVGLREEYNFEDYNRQPRLYFSTVDRRLHMIGARAGVIILDAKTSISGNSFDFTNDELTDGTAEIYRSVMYSDTDQDGYFDTWTRQQGKPDQQLIVRPDLAVLTSENGLQVKQLSQGFAARLWQTAPPTNTKEWRDLGVRLAKDAAVHHTADDLAAMFADLPGSVTVLSGAAITHLSTNPDRFIASIHVQKPARQAQAGSLRDGEYVLQNENGKLSVQPPQPPTIQLSPITVTRVENTNTPLYGYIDFTAQNAGSTDAYPVEINVQQQVGIFYVTVFDQTVTLPAKGQKQFHVAWSPASGGKFTLSVEARYAPLPIALSVTVTPQASATPNMLPQPTAVLPQPTAVLPPHRPISPIVAQQSIDYKVDLPVAPSPLFFSDNQSVLLVILLGVILLTMLIVLVIFLYENERNYVNSD
ncbi:MAG: hypothetical protein ABI947_19030 [Chloroflexota bacterium]